MNELLKVIEEWKLESESIMIEYLLKQAVLVIPRLEKLTPDSSWAHQASGHRRGLIRLARRLETHMAMDIQQNELTADLEADIQAMKQSLAQSFFILEEAARERM